MCRRLSSLPYTSRTPRGDASLPHEDAQEAVVDGAAGHGRLDRIDTENDAPASLVSHTVHVAVSAVWAGERHVQLILLIADPSENRRSP